MLCYSNGTDKKAKATGFSRPIPRPMILGQSSKIFKTKPKPQTLFEANTKVTSKVDSGEKSKSYKNFGAEDKVF